MLTSISEGRRIAEREIQGNANDLGDSTEDYLAGGQQQFHLVLTKFLRKLSSNWKSNGRFCVIGTQPTILKYQYQL
jgi:hypothetical protein